MKVTLTTKELKIVDNGNNCRDFIFVISYSHFFVSYIHNKKHVFILTLIPNAQSQLSTSKMCKAALDIMHTQIFILLFKNESCDEQMSNSNTRDHKISSYG